MSYYMSLLTMYTYDPTLFDDMLLPEGCDRETITSTILSNLAEMEVIYPDVPFMKYMLGIFSKSRITAWTKMYDALEQYYNPLWNKEGTLEETIHNTNVGDSNNQATGITDHNVTAYNTDDPRLSTRDNAESSAAVHSTAEGTQQTTRKEYGNIGVTTSQAMLKEEIDVRSSYDIAHLIMAEVKREFCLMIY